MLSVDVSDDRVRTQEFYEENGFVIPNAFDTRNVAVGLYRVAGTPTTFLVDSEGRIIWRRYGFLPGEEGLLRERVRALLDEE